MDSNTRTQIILAAVNAAGPVGVDQSGWALQVEELAAAITTMVGDQSRLAKTVDRVAGAKVFRGAVVRVRKEPSSGRGVVVLFTGTNRQSQDVIDGGLLPDGCESVRTERTDDPVGLRMARRVADLVGHDVTVWVELEEVAGGGKKVRVLRHVEDGGLSKAPLAVEALRARQARMAGQGRVQAAAS